MHVVPFDKLFGIHVPRPISNFDNDEPFSLLLQMTTN